MSVTLTWTDENMKHKIMEEKQLEQKLVQTVKKNSSSRQEWMECLIAFCCSAEAESHLWK